jgi:hypothetical protein
MREKKWSHRVTIPYTYALPMPTTYSPAVLHKITAGQNVENGFGPHQHDPVETAAAVNKAAWWFQ